ncbi:MAG TPA: DUF3300 domain-containing protein, partial [Rhodocyclaceae bacterium]|nr:DUF3300 domain-containing protein [Rhodocyclaceae bacterium]
MRTRLLSCMLAVLPLAMALPSQVQAQDAPAAAAQAVYSKEQLDQLLAPIALYPDGVLAQVLMASTYPLEVVEAARWIEAVTSCCWASTALPRSWVHSSLSLIMVITCGKATRDCTL